ncbi:MAG: hypothetical protein ABEJ43_09980 [Haloferacaceae archaeon]
MVDIDHPAETWGFAVFGTLAALVATALPVVALVRVVPALKEVLIGAALVYLLLETTELGDGAAFAAVAGMAATVLFNVLAAVVGAVVGVALLGGADAVAGMGTVAGVDLPVVLRAVRLFTILVVSPVGYTAGGALGAYLNRRAEEDADDTAPETPFS